MSCFPYPPDTDVKPIQAPLLAKKRLPLTKSIGLSTYLKLYLRARNILSRAFSEDESLDAKLALPSAAAITQASLFFGLAAAALGRDVQPKEFATSDPNKPRASIDVCLPTWYHQELRRRWAKLDEILTAEKLEARRKKLQGIYDSVRMDIGLLDNVLAAELDQDNLPEIILSIHMLLYVIADVLSFDHYQADLSLESSVTTEMLKQRMIDNGWCKKRLNFLGTSPMFYPALYYLSSIKPPRVRSEDHSRCSSAKCLVTSSLSMPLHRADECLCEDIEVPHEKLKNIVTSGGIPVVKLTRSPAGKLIFEMVPYTPSRKFVAISHVWADRQFGSTRNTLPECQVKFLAETISTLPTHPDDWHWYRRFVGWRYPRSAEIMPPNPPYEYFWLDSFCIPQAPEEKELRSRAIDSMNLIYAAASYTLVFDKGMQSLDAGRRPASLWHGDRATFYSPQNTELLRVLANVYSSNWMGRAWTLQEGVLSGHVSFPLNGSLGLLKLLWPYHEDRSRLWDIRTYWNVIMSKIPRHLRRLFRDELPKTLGPALQADLVSTDNSDSFEEAVRHQLWTHMKSSLQVDDHRDYARTPADRATKFVEAHTLLQSRTTTEVKDLPLILMNMSCMNANVISQKTTTDARMKQLFYGLESVPTELLFSDCMRQGSCDVDAWIPQEIAPERFGGKHTLKLTSEGFLFDTKAETEPLKFFLLSSPHPPDHFQISEGQEEVDKITSMTFAAIRPLKEAHLTASTNEWCVVISGGGVWKAARFLVNRAVEDQYFLHFDCPLRIVSTPDSKSANDDQTKAVPKIDAVRMQGSFIIERSHDSPELSTSRPMNPDQYSDRLIAIHGALHFLLGYGETYIIRAILGDENALRGFSVLWFLFTWAQMLLVEKALYAFVHRAWMATYQPGWDPNGWWKWFWKLSNFQPPVPFKTLMRWYCRLMFSICFHIQYWSGVGIVTLYWLPLYSTQELWDLYLTGFLLKIGYWILLRIGGFGGF